MHGIERDRVQTFLCSYRSCAHGHTHCESRPFHMTALLVTKTVPVPFVIVMNEDQINERHQ